MYMVYIFTVRCIYSYKVQCTQYVYVPCSAHRYHIRRYTYTFRWLVTYADLVKYGHCRLGGCRCNAFIEFLSSSSNDLMFKCPSFLWLSEWNINPSTAFLLLSSILLNVYTYMWGNSDACLCVCVLYVPLPFLACWQRALLRSHWCARKKLKALQKYT